MFWIIAITLLGISFAPFIFPMLDIWHAQGLWVQLGLVLAFSFSFFDNSRAVRVINIPLALLHGWVALMTLWMAYQLQLLNKSNHTVVYPYFNFLVLLIFYKLVIQHLSCIKIQRILNWLKYIVIITLITAALQKFGLSQFFKLLIANHHSHNNIVVGFIGNGTHLSGYLGMCVPLFLMRINRENIIALVLMALVMMFTGTTINDPAISGYIVAWLVIAYYLFVKNKKGLIIWLGSTFVVGYLAYLVLDKDILLTFFGDNGRLGFWRYYWDIFRQSFPITGLGLGKLNRVHALTPFPGGRHLHLEYYHFMFELGIVGLVLILNLIKRFFEIRAKTETQFTLKLIVFGFCVSCCFNYPAHLWMTSTLAMFAYASFFALKNEEI